MNWILDHFSWNESYLRAQWWTAGMIACGYFTYYVWLKKQSIWIASAFGYALMNGLFVSMFPVSVYFGLNGAGAGHAAQASSAISSLMLTLGAFLFCSINTTNRFKIKGLFSAIILIDSAIVIIQALLFKDQFFRSGLMQNASMNSCFIALTYPLVAFLPSYSKNHAYSVLDILDMSLCAIMPIIAVILSGSTLGVAMMISVFIVHSILAYPYKFFKNPHLYIFPVVIFLSAWFISDRGLIHDSGRLTLWKCISEWQWNQSRMWFGSGLGMFENLGPMIHLSAGKLTAWRYYHEHNDWLQILFELGAIGLVLSIGAYCVALYRSKNIPWLFCSFIGLGIFMAGNMPSHYPLSAIYMVFLLSCIRSGVENNSQTTKEK